MRQYKSPLFLRNNPNRYQMDFQTRIPIIVKQLGPRCGSFVNQFHKMENFKAI